MDRAFPVPPLMGRMTRDVLALLPSRLVQSVSSAYFTGGQPRFGYETLANALESLRQTLATVDIDVYRLDNLGRSARGKETMAKAALDILV